MPINPMVLASLISTIGGPALAGIFGGNNDRDDALDELDPSRILGYANTFQKDFLRSPAYGAGRQSVLGGAQSAQRAISTSLGQRGLGTSGIGAVAPALAQSSGALKLGQLQAQAWQSALDRAFGLATARAGASVQTPNRFGPREIFGGGLDALSKYLLFSSMFKQGGQDPGLYDPRNNRENTGYGT